MWSIIFICRVQHKGRIFLQQLLDVSVCYRDLNEAGIKDRTFFNDFSDNMGANVLNNKFELRVKRQIPIKKLQNVTQM